MDIVENVPRDLCSRRIFLLAVWMVLNKSFNFLHLLSDVCKILINSLSLNDSHALACEICNVDGKCNDGNTICSNYMYKSYS